MLHMVNTSLQKKSGCRLARFGDYPELLASVCLVTDQQSKPVHHTELVIRDIALIQLTPVPECVTVQEAGN